ncbi:GNAT family N-acetyltransferase [Allohahella marinimesophila]|uniref:GNAT family N-acetyltransferase n=1 Tax=Allohahella marinimesophila TaxID=1054972 RepID=A0ABP7NFL6_9GAMM
MTNITVHQAIRSDLDDVAELFDKYRQFYGQPSDIQAARRFLLARVNNGESIILLAKQGEQIVGFAQLFPAFSSVSLARTFILNDLYVSPAGRRQGVATRLLLAAEEFAKKVGAVRLTLSTATTNEPAQALYKLAGWKRDENFHVFHRVIPA